MTPPPYVLPSKVVERLTFSPPHTTRHPKKDRSPLLRPGPNSAARYINKPHWRHHLRQAHARRLPYPQPPNAQRHPTTSPSCPWPRSLPLSQQLPIRALPSLSWLHKEKEVWYPSARHRRVHTH